jgi:hypothetical protein
MARTKGALNKHKKENPVKEKKKRGRKPGSIKQKQEQHQVVNVNINSKEGKHRHSATRKEKKKQVQNPMPSFGPDCGKVESERSLFPPFDTSWRDRVRKPTVSPEENVRAE